MKLKQLLKEQTLLESGGEKAGKLELSDVTSKQAFDFFQNIADDEITIINFEENFNIAKKIASKGSEKRKNMPVINLDQINTLQQHLEQGNLDVFDLKTNKYHKSFPEGLSGKQAEEWLAHGLHDGSKVDDIIRVSRHKKMVCELIPTQNQIYVDKSIESIVEYGIFATKMFLTNQSLTIISNDGYILDGHHRWLSGMLLDQRLLVNVIEIDFDKKKLLKLLNAYSDAIGNTRNG